MTTEGPNTHALLEAFQGGCDRSLNQLFERHYSRVRKVVALRTHRRVRDLREDEDIVQEAMVSALLGVERFVANTEVGFRVWLARIATNAVIDSARKGAALKRGEGRVVSLPEGDDTVLCDGLMVDRGPTPSQVCMGTELEVALEDGILQLSETERTVVIERKLLNRSFEDIALELGVKNTSTVRATLARALGKLSKVVAS